MNIITHKKCIKCLNTLPIDQFYKQKDTKDRLHPVCKPCFSEANKIRYNSNKDKVKQRSSSYYGANKTKVLNRIKEHYSKNKNKVLWYQKLYRLLNIDKVKENHKRWYDNNKEKVREKSKKWYENNKEKHVESSRKSSIKWRKTHPEKVKLLKQIRRAREKGSFGKIDPKDWKALIEKYGNKCVYPGCKNTNVEMDHVIPLKLGGTNTIDNVQPLCKHHNSSKGAKYIDYR